MLTVRGGITTRRQAAIIHTELQAMRTLLQGYTVKNVHLPLLVVPVALPRPLLVSE